MKYYFDVSYKSLNKKGEELCGDNVVIGRGKKNTIVVLSDGLGSGVKANILATLTSKIAATLLVSGVTIEETVDTIVNTLPECNIRKLAYSTFTILKMSDDGRVYLAEYDNPPIFIYRNGEEVKTSNNEKIINGKKIRETIFNVEIGDTLVFVSDGAVHAGIGELLNLGWQWDNINEYLKEVTTQEKTANGISTNFINVCNNLYNKNPGDDTTVVVVKIKQHEFVNILTGPPRDTNKDKEIAKKLINSDGKKVICGGTTANIIARELNKSVNVKIDTMSKDIPPIASIDGLDLVTEGILTLTNVVEKLKSYNNANCINENLASFRDNDGAAMLTNLLINECTHLNLFVGTAVNPAHQNPNLPSDLNIKNQIIRNLVAQLEILGKEVSVSYV